jgi:hypothetical protein
MKQAIWSLSVFLMLAGTPALHAFETFGFTWERSYMPVYFNPEFMPELYAEDDPRMNKVLSLEVREELRIQIFEEKIREAAHTWSNEPDNTLVVMYQGRTNEPCGELLHTTTRICLQPDYQHYATARTSLRSGGKFAMASKIILNANPDRLTQVWTYITAMHEMGHSIGFKHVEKVVAKAIMNPSFDYTMTSLYPDDSAGLRHLYPFTEACAPVFDMEGGQLGFWAEIYLPGVLHRVRLNYREPGYLEVVAAPLLDISSQERSCALKLDGNELFIPYIELEGQTYWLKLELNPVLPGEAITLDLVDYQPVPD